MTREERNNKLKHLITCMKCEVSGKSCDENCPTQYDAGNMGEIIENLEAISKVLEQEPIWIPVSEKLPEDKETVLVTFKHHISGKTIGLGSVVVLRGKPHWHVREQNLGTYDVIAWMPLPKPYGSAESEENEKKQIEEMGRTPRENE